MDVDLIVAWRIDACLEGDMAWQDLAPALREMDDQIPDPYVAVERPRVRQLIEDVAVAVESRDPSQLEAVARSFLGAHPADVVAAGPPDWTAQVPAAPHLRDVAWPPEPIRTERLLLRASEARDRPGLVELYSSVEVFRFLGGPRPRTEIEDQPGLFVVERDGELIGTMSLSQRDPARPGGGGVELSYLLLPAAWGSGYATEAARAALAWVAEALPGQPVVLCTQVANTPSRRLAERLGFVELERFEEFGAEQWFGVLRPARAAG